MGVYNRSMKTYNARRAREKFKEVLDEVDEGSEVLILRNSKIYQVVRYDGKNDKQS
ncbi:MAG: hypothetical protein DDT42_01899 [candidate division WS2 bacterium]|uniref:Antitoxin n=1 Tax=Psychracetigena formicireducens TaxID=2986056 RepID=A0A9E2BK62_PSYF1|nr:hypothetical protein [Candidatus Psychracetigena formicireducens]